jgi:hypothetical protein
MYTCERCGYASNKKWNIKKHLNKVSVCEPIVSDINIDVLRQKYIKQDTDIKCMWCETSFAYRSAKYTHQKTCHMRNDFVLEIQDLKSQVKQIQKRNTEIDKMKKQLYEIKASLKSSEVGQGSKHMIQNIDKQNIAVQNNTNTQSNQSITINNFFNTDTSNLSQELIKHCLHSCNIIPLLENVFFNPEIPENHNIRVENNKKKTLAVFNGLDWQPKDKQHVTCQMINNFGFKIVLKFFIENYEDRFGDYRIQYPDITQLYRPIEEEQDIEEQEAEMREIKEWIEELENIKHRPRLLDKISDDVFTVAVRNRLYVCQKVRNS